MTATMTITTGRQPTASGGRRAASQRAKFADALRLAPAVFWSILIIVPMIYLVLIPFRTRTEYAQNPLGFPTSLNIENFAKAWSQGRLDTAFLNTAVVTVVSIAGIVAFSSIAAYAIVRWNGRAGGTLYALFAFGLIIPFQLGLPALYKMWAQAGLVNSLLGVILIQIGAGIPLAVFLYAAFLRNFPVELEEAAKIDGAGEFRTFVTIVFPLLKPVTATVIVLSAISIWNDLVISLYFLQSPERQTLPKATVGFSSSFNSDLPVIFACAVLTVIPIIVAFVALQRFILSGLTSGALKN